MNKGKKTDLFRFVTMRSPELISKSREDLGFIKHPDPGSSHFIEVVHTMTDIDAGRVILKNKAESFTGSHTPDTLKAISSEFWNFSDWLVKNKANLTRTSIDEKIVSLPSAAQILEIWDYLFYEVIENRNPNNRETCLQLIIAINFAQKYTSYAAAGTTDETLLQKEAKDLKRLAEGKVILHQSFTHAKDTSYSPTAFKGAHNYRHIEALHNARIAALKVKELKEMKDVFHTFEKRYRSEFKTALNAKLKPYQTEVKNKIASFFTQNPDELAKAKVSVDKSFKAMKSVNGVGTELSKSLVKLETDLESVVPPGTVEAFEFTFDAPLSKAYTAKKIPASAENFIAEKNLEESTIKMAINSVDREIKSYKKQSNTFFRRKPHEILVNGIPVKSNPLRLRDVTISFHSFEDDGETRFFAYLSIEAGYEKAFVRSADFTLKIGANVHTSSAIKLLSNASETIFAKAFMDEDIFTIDDAPLISFTGTFELSNGQLYTFDIDGSSSETLISGSAVPTKSIIANEDMHYGVNKVGVADYRRVEQELCCYVPGEVAHIENVMAREYKEYSTRNLIRNQTSFESKNEQEKEDTLDSSVTSRNEMNTEISSVVDEENSKNFGFNGSVSGEISNVKVTAGGSADFSMGKSSSDSNSRARTMAEDITKRAVERITSKISTKRKSKLIQEFEERNSHGLDNRAGDKHVTGVYRWVDKLYKNRIINYGKRLMYEFMVPEPARFYKEALIIKAEETQLLPKTESTNEDDVLIKPLHPSAYEVVNASVISRSNYNRIAAYYDIDVTAPPERFVNQSISFAEAIGSSDGEMSFTYENLLIEPNYECMRVTGSIDCSYESVTKNYGFIKCSIGGLSNGFWLGDSKGWSRVLYINQPTNAIEGGLPISVNTKKITAFAGSLVAESELKLTVYENWQQTVYKEILNAYEVQMDAYKRAETLAKEEKEREAANNAVKAANKPKDQVLATNSKFNQQRAHTELKRLCIEMLTKPFGIEIGKDFYQNGKHDIPVIKQGSTLDQYASIVTFFEQAFDWEILSERYYPYYWADRADWKTLFQTQDGNDYSFQAFLQSGMARVVVPVREGFEDAVTFFMETGQVWNGSGIVINTSDKLYLSIVDETTNIEGKIEGEEWETLVPTTLRILQGKSVFLNEEGLPCCEGETTTLLPDNNILNAEKPTEEPPAS